MERRGGVSWRDPGRFVFWPVMEGEIEKRKYDKAWFGEEFLAHPPLAETQRNLRTSMLRAVGAGHALLMENENAKTL